MVPEPSLLQGHRVIDVAGFIAGPAAITMLADVGSDMEKRERLFQAGVIQRARV